MFSRTKCSPKSLEKGAPKDKTTPWCLAQQLHGAGGEECVQGVSKTGIN